MPSSLYVVIESLGKWWVDLEGKAHGPYSSKAVAIEEGRSLARFAAHAGKHSELLAQNETGRFIVLWDSVKEPYGARGYHRNSAA
jgi:hypothetical protein